VIEADKTNEVQEYIKSRKGETDQSTLDFVARIVSLEKQKKDIMEDIKAVKEDAKAEGVDTTKAMKAFRKFCYILKTDPADLVIEEGVLALIEDDVTLISSISELISKR
jgi:uncharacterized protein (UPF0335 family)